MSIGSLKQKAVKGVGWSAIDNITKYGISFVVSIVLARLLSPDDYGLLGLIAIFTSICEAIINGGFYSALMRKKDVTDLEYNTVFFVNIGTSLVLYLLIFSLAPAISSFFKREELIALTRISSLGMIIGAFSIVQQVRLSRKIDFKTQTITTLIASIISGVIGISMAVMGYGVWALVIQQLSSRLLRTVALCMVNKWIPQFKFSYSCFLDLFSFGWKLMVSRLLDTTWQELYQVIVGKFYSPATLGQYTRAKSISQLLSSNLTEVVQRVSYPVLSSIQDEKKRMVDAYRRIIKTTMFVAAISMLFMAAVSEPLVYCLIGPQWHEASSYLPLICIAGSLYPMHAINLNMLQLQGRSDLFLILEIIKKIIALVPLFIGAFVGVIPMLLTSLITGIIAFFLNSHYSGKLLGYSSWSQLKDVSPHYLLAICISLVVWPLKYLPISYWLILPSQLVLGMCAFILLYKRFSLNEYNEIKEMFLSFLHK